MVTSLAAGLVFLFAALPTVSGGSLAGAPRELDPKLSAIAPEQCLWYGSLAGTKAPDSGSNNHTEQLLAEPQVQRFVREVEKQVLAAIERVGAQNEEFREVADSLRVLGCALATQPVAAYVADVRHSESEGIAKVEIEAAIVMSASDARDNIREAVDKVLAIAAEKGIPLIADETAGVTWQRVDAPADTPKLRIGWKGDYLIVAIGEQTPEKVTQRLEGEEPPRWLTEIREMHSIEREMAIGYLNIAKILERLKPAIDEKDPEAWSHIETLGLTSIQALHGINGYDEVGTRSVAHLVTDGQRRGLLAFLPYKPLKQEDFALIPNDALVAVADRLDPAEAWDNALRLAVSFEPDAGAELNEHLAKVKDHLGIDVRTDIIETLGDVWTAYLPAGDIFTSWLNAGAAVQVKDASRLRESIIKLTAVANSELSRQGAKARIRESEVETAAGSQKIYTLEFVGEPVPVSPSWCVADEWLVTGLGPQAVRSMLDRESADSLAGSAAVREAIEDAGEASLVFYQDTPQLARMLYPWVQMGVQMISGPLRKQGIEIDVTSLPSSEVIIKHLRPGTLTWRHSDDGFHFDGRGSLGGHANLASAAPLLGAVMIPAAFKARDAARDAQDQSNMKQIALAMFLYHDVNGAFPTDVYGDDGKALLSWRVKLLPYLEQQALYDRFRMDEAWDSEHNRPLTEEMPEVLRSQAGIDGPSMTRYVALEGKNTIFRGADPVKMQEITDGMSNTLMFVLINPDRAVTWSAPDDRDFDAEASFAGLDSPQGTFLAAMADGSVRRISTAIGKDALVALTTISGGEVLGGALEAPPGPPREESDPAGIR